jgi:hypothetical protein
MRNRQRVTGGYTVPRDVTARPGPRSMDDLTPGYWFAET